MGEKGNRDLGKGRKKREGAVYLNSEESFACIVSIARGELGKKALRAGIDNLQRTTEGYNL